ncbi:hypothetical protein GCM10027037_28790 [Mucilaginibacter koreensis]
MKNITYYTAALLCLLCFSCKKDHSGDKPDNTGADTKLYPFTLSLASFSQNMTTLGIRTESTNQPAVKTNAIAALKDTIDVLYYTINNGYRNTRSLTQTSDMADFGTIRDSVPAGTYTVYLVAGKKGLIKSRAYIGDPSFDSLDDFVYAADSNTVASNMAPWKDVFVKKLTFKVPGVAPAAQQVTLERGVAQLQINVTDAVPANAATVEADIIYDIASINYVPQWNGSRPLNANAFALTPKYKVKVPAAMIGETGLQLTTYTMNYYYPFSVILTAYDAAGNRIAGKNIDNVTAKQNMRTVLSGKLFDGVPSIGFGVTTNQAWTTVNRGF